MKESHRGSDAEQAFGVISSRLDSGLMQLRCPGGHGHPFERGWAGPTAECGDLPDFRGIKFTNLSLVVSLGKLHQCNRIQFHNLISVTVDKFELSYFGFSQILF